MTYAFLTEGLDAERRLEFDRILEPPEKSRKVQARQERALLGKLLGGDYTVKG